MAIKKINNEVTKLTKEVFEETDEFLDELVKQQTEFEMFESISEEDLKFIKKSIKLYKDYKNLAISVAKQQDNIQNMLIDLNAKVDRLLERQ